MTDEKTCPHCGASVESAGRLCPECGFDLESQVADEVREKREQGEFEPKPLSGEPGDRGAQ